MVIREFLFFSQAMMINEVKLELKKKLPGFRIKRDREYGAGWYEGRLIECKWQNLPCQFTFLKGERLYINVVGFNTGLPRYGFVNGDWFSIGNPGGFPELGN